MQLSLGTTPKKSTVRHTTHPLEQTPYTFPGLMKIWRKQTYEGCWEECKISQKPWKRVGVLQKPNPLLPYDFTIPLLGIYCTAMKAFAPQHTHAYTHTRACAHVLRALLASQLLKRLRAPQEMNESTTVYACNGPQLGIKIERALTHATGWMVFKRVILNENS